MRSGKAKTKQQRRSDGTGVVNRYTSTCSFPPVCIPTCGSQANSMREVLAPLPWRYVRLTPARGLLGSSSAHDAPSRVPRYACEDRKGHPGRGAQQL